MSIDEKERESLRFVLKCGVFVESFQVPVLTPTMKQKKKRTGGPPIDSWENKGESSNSVKYKASIGCHLTIFIGLM